LAFLGFLSFAGNEFKISYRKFILITVGLILFGILDEFHQRLIPGRSFNIKDIFSDILGILGVLIFSVVIFREIADRNKKMFKIDGTIRG
jgi:VanZ family protein